MLEAPRALPTPMCKKLILKVNSNCTYDINNCVLSFPSKYFESSPLELYFVSAALEELLIKK